MEKQFYITEEEREKCRKVIDAFAELYEIEDEDILLLDVSRYGFVKLQCYILSHGFEELDTYTDSNSLFEGFWDEWFNINLFLIARKMRLDNIVGEEVFNKTVSCGRQSSQNGEKKQRDNADNPDGGNGGKSGKKISFATFQTAFRYISQKSTKFLPINEVEI